MSYLNTPVALGAIELLNRNIMSAMTRNRSLPTSIPNDTNVEYYKQRAHGGAGLIVTEGILIVQQGTEWPHAPGIWTDEHVNGWKKVTDAVHAEGSKIVAQLWHCGRVSHPDMPEQIASGQPIWAPSAIAARGGKFRTLPGVPGYVTPVELPDPQVIIEQFRNAAIKAKEAGFDGVELHGANGYLPHQFLDSTSNKRTDMWGGSVENRARFILEATKALVSVWGADRVAVKLNPAGGYNDMGMPLEETLETFTYLIKELDEMKLAYLALSRYLPMSDPVFDGKTRATQHDVLNSYRPFIENTKLVLNGGLTPSEADGLIQSGEIDAAAFALLWIAHPDMQKRIEAGKPLDAELDFKNIYWHEGITVEKGYTDYVSVVA
ncbi:hypothetical protein M422DRAFT_231647 [Sphaerobolus stellatus SS14]|uniref:NADH:flavin oxidoreductase/NADH oxidase N-terminal domain-containing protein n=1 Tax=Sphaerobolus stellatus (strain SS14) TaxID=990650 RepID=A0A0C9U3V6_SPHS4|nr:hypothetical protein M422DRAFT_786177 [Sphaerobolus stellatus SS14]KIJ37588.1 hypothetical protein M422DRAFT_231647 [Sphaerobolus stellatus SS14]